MNSISKISKFDMSVIYKDLLKEFEKVPTVYLIEKKDSEPYVWLSNEEGNEILQISGTTQDEVVANYMAAIFARKTGNCIVKKISNADISILATPRIKSLYSVALDICDTLQIPCPPIYIKRLREGIGGVTYFIPGEDGTQVISRVYIAPAGLKMQTINLAHELRHCWQAWERRMYAFSPTSLEEYLFEPLEVDAVAFSFLYFEQYYTDNPYVILNNGGMTIYNRIDYQIVLIDQIQTLRTEGYFSNDYRWVA